MTKEKIKQYTIDIQNFACLYLEEAITFEEAIDKIFPLVEELYCIRWEHIIDKMIDYKNIVSEEEANGSTKN